MQQHKLLALYYQEILILQHDIKMYLERANREGSKHSQLHNDANLIQEGGINSYERMGITDVCGILGYITTCMDKTRQITQ